MNIKTFVAMAKNFNQDMGLLLWNDRAQQWLPLATMERDSKLGAVKLMPLDAKGMLPIEALKLMKNAADEAHRFWDSDKDAKVGKLLLSMAGYLPGYRIDMDEVHKLLDK